MASDRSSLTTIVDFRSLVWLIIGCIFALALLLYDISSDTAIENDAQMESKSFPSFQQPSSAMRYF